MDKQIVLWKRTTCTTDRGTDVNLEMGELIDRHCRRTLLSQILKMPPKKSISFNDAARMLDIKLFECFKAGEYGNKRGQYHWYTQNFVPWISEQGFHIELTGDEFDLYAMTSVLS